MKVSLALLASSLSLASSFSPYPPTFARSPTSLSSEVSRSDFVRSASSAAASFASLASLAVPVPIPAHAQETVTLPSGVSYAVTKSGDGPKPSIGEMAAIRFGAKVAETGNVIDDIFDTPEPYYTRIGSGGLLKGVEEVLPKMRVGDRWTLTVPGPLAFGKKGRPASAGKPRVPSDATIVFDVEMVGLPGKEVELIELIGDE